MKWIHLSIAIILAILIWQVPAPESVAKEGMPLLAIFVGAIYAIITKPLPMGAISLIAVLVLILTKTLSFGDAFSGFTSDIVWLIVFAYFISRGIINTGLGNRIAFLFMRRFGKRTLGLSYSLAVTDLVLAPAIPSSTARAGGIVLPILKSISIAFGSHAHQPDANRVGTYLTLTAFHITCISSAMFLTAMGGNPLIVDLAAQSGVKITWLSWALAASVPGIISIVILPYLIFKLFPPIIKQTPDAPEYAQRKLKEMGRVSFHEWLMLFVFVGLVGLWIFGESVGIKAAVTALMGVAVLLIAGVLSWKDLMKEDSAWDTLIWFASLAMMAGFLNKLGVIHWFGDWVAGNIHGYSWQAGFAVMALVYFFTHYFFASNLAHISAMYAAFLVVSIALGTPPYLAAFVLAFFSNLFGTLTHYGCGPAPILFGAGYVPIGKWWQAGLILSLVNIVIWFGIGGLWWKFLNLW